MIIYSLYCVFSAAYILTKESTINQISKKDLLPNTPGATGPLNVWSPGAVGLLDHPALPANV